VFTIRPFCPLLPFLSSIFYMGGLTGLLIAGSLVPNSRGVFVDFFFDHFFLYFGNAKVPNLLLVQGYFAIHFPFFLSLLLTSPSVPVLSPPPVFFPTWQTAPLL